MRQLCTPPTIHSLHQLFLLTHCSQFPSPHSYFDTTQDDDDLFLLDEDLFADTTIAPPTTATRTVAKHGALIAQPPPLPRPQVLYRGRSTSSSPENGAPVINTIGPLGQRGHVKVMRASTKTTARMVPRPTATVTAAAAAATAAVAAVGVKTGKRDAATREAILKSNGAKTAT